MIGMSLGRNVKALRPLNWEIVIVALMTFTASFIAAAFIARSPWLVVLVAAGKASVLGDRPQSIAHSISRKE